MALATAFQLRRTVTERDAVGRPYEMAECTVLRSLSYQVVDASRILNDAIWGSLRVRVVESELPAFVEGVSGTYGDWLKSERAVGFVPAHRWQNSTCVRLAEKTRSPVVVARMRDRKAQPYTSEEHIPDRVAELAESAHGTTLQLTDDGLALWKLLRHACAASRDAARTQELANVQPQQGTILEFAQQFDRSVSHGTSMLSALDEADAVRPMAALLARPSSARTTHDSIAPGLPSFVSTEDQMEWAAEIAAMAAETLFSSDVLTPPPFTCAQPVCEHFFAQIDANVDELYQGDLRDGHVRVLFPALGQVMNVSDHAWKAATSHDDNDRDQGASHTVGGMMDLLQFYKAICATVVREIFDANWEDGRAGDVDASQKLLGELTRTFPDSGLTADKLKGERAVVLEEAVKAAVKAFGRADENEAAAYVPLVKRFPTNESTPDPVSTRDDIKMALLLSRCECTPPLHAVARRSRIDSFNEIIEEVWTRGSPFRDRLVEPPATSDGWEKLHDDVKKLRTLLMKTGGWNDGPCGSIVGDMKMSHVVLVHPLADARFIDVESAFTKLVETPKRVDSKFGCLSPASFLNLTLLAWACLAEAHATPPEQAVYPKLLGARALLDAITAHILAPTDDATSALPRPDLSRLDLPVIKMIQARLQHYYRISPSPSGGHGSHSTTFNPPLPVFRWPSSTTDPSVHLAQVLAWPLRPHARRGIFLETLKRVISDSVRPTAAAGGTSMAVGPQGTRTGLGCAQVQYEANHLHQLVPRVFEPLVGGQKDLSTDLLRRACDWFNAPYPMIMTYNSARFEDHVTRCGTANFTSYEHIFDKLRALTIGMTKGWDSSTTNKKAYPYRDSDFTKTEDYPGIWFMLCQTAFPGWMPNSDHILLPANPSEQAKEWREALLKMLPLPATGDNWKQATRSFTRTDTPYSRKLKSKINKSFMTSDLFKGKYHPIPKDITHAFYILSKPPGSNMTWHIDAPLAHQTNKWGTVVYIILGPDEMRSIVHTFEDPNNLLEGIGIKDGPVIEETDFSKWVKGSRDRPTNVRKVWVNGTWVDLEDDFPANRDSTQLMQADRPLRVKLTLPDEVIEAVIAKQVQVAHVRGGEAEAEAESDVTATEPPISRLRMSVVAGTLPNPSVVQLSSADAKTLGLENGAHVTLLGSELRRTTSVVEVAEDLAAGEARLSQTSLEHVHLQEGEYVIVIPWDRVVQKRAELEREKVEHIAVVGERGSVLAFEGDKLHGVENVATSSVVTITPIADELLYDGGVHVPELRNVQLRKAPFGLGIQQVEVGYEFYAKSRTLSLSVTMGSGATLATNVRLPREMKDPPHSTGNKQYKKYMADVRPRPQLVLAINLPRDRDGA
jgi:hypothetical protein